MKRVIFGLLVFALVTQPCWAGGLTLSIRNGKVSLDAQEVTLRQILAEWARVGKTQIVNLERVASPPMTLKFDGIPEKQALDIVLRSVPGYMAAPRATAVADASIYDRILIMPTTTAVATARPSSPGFQTAQPFPPSPNVTQLRAMPPQLTPGVLPDPSDNGLDMSDPAIAAAAAAGLIAVPATQPGVLRIDPRLAVPQSRPVTTSTPAQAPPTNFWNAPAGTAQPAVAPPQPVPAPAPPLRPGTLGPPQPDR